MIQLPKKATAADMAPPIMIPNNWLEKKSVAVAGGGLATAIMLSRIMLVKEMNTHHLTLSTSLTHHNYSLGGSCVDLLLKVYQVVSCWSTRIAEGTMQYPIPDSFRP